MKKKDEATGVENIVEWRRYDEERKRGKERPYLSLKLNRADAEVE